ncbi:MFS transporter [Bradyrhizobium diazoefficiens]|nr:MFS transporter [Bradyrhizobium diazoefficiens]QQO20610.1 MFS transporter [Bradyrhizobium diazoefficiens]
MSIAKAESARLSAAPQAKWKVVVLASLGGALEIYDFIIYGVFALEIGKEFFPKSNPLVSLISTFSVFAVGYASRPLGGIILSSFGDRFGRRIMLLISVLGMSVCTVSIGLIPNYATIGIAAPMLLVLLRMAQGFFLAGELPCSITYVVEEIPKRASFVSGLVIFCLNSGVLLATLISLSLHSSYSASEVMSYGWRLAFIFGGMIGLLSYWVRTSLDESAAFERMKSHAVRRPFRTILSEFRTQALIGIGIAAIVNASNNMLFVVLPSYLTGVLHYGAAEVSAGQNIGILTLSGSLLLVAWLGDRFSSRILHRIGSLIFLLVTFPLYWAIAEYRIVPLQLFVVIGVIGGLVNGTYAFLLADLFPTSVRFSGVGLSLNLTTVVFTGLTPLLVTYLIRETGMNAAPGVYISLVALLSLLVGFPLSRHRGRIQAEAVSTQADTVH